MQSTCERFILAKFRRCRTCGWVRVMCLSCVIQTTIGHAPAKRDACSAGQQPLPRFSYVMIIVHLAIPRQVRRDRMLTSYYIHFTSMIHFSDCNRTDIRQSVCHYNSYLLNDNNSLFGSAAARRMHFYLRTISRATHAITSCAKAAAWCVRVSV